MSMSDAAAAAGEGDDDVPLAVSVECSTSARMERVIAGGRADETGCQDAQTAEIDFGTQGGEDKHERCVQRGDGEYQH